MVEQKPIRKEENPDMLKACKARSHDDREPGSQEEV